ncbi:MAG: hypothetical protein EP348_12650 [Alphaproteobacteria bacterium]|nr:MAG: hypothetical protein EP348_12650 [Alphaproteobacteria bacterium]
MTSGNYVRLRQICLATLDIAGTEETFNHVLGLKVCHRSRLDAFGLENIMYAVNGVFLEIVAPTKENTAVHRFLARHGGMGGYMAIFDCTEVSHHKALAAAAGIDPIYERYNDAADLLQLNPKQTGITMLEIDHHTGGDDMFGAYEWAGEGWQDYVDTTVSGNILGLGMTSPKAAARAALWAGILDRPVRVGEPGLIEVKLDYGRLTFREGAGSAPELFDVIEMTARDRRAMIARADKAGLPVSDTGFEICGVHFRLQGAA